MGEPTKSNILVFPAYGGGSLPGEVKHLSSQRKRNNIDAPSSGERGGYSLNFCLVSLLIWQEGCRDDTAKAEGYKFDD